MLINITQYPAAILEPEERDFWGEYELDELEGRLSQEEAFRVIEGRVFEAVWPSEDIIPW